MSSPPETGASPSPASQTPSRALAIVGFANSGKTELICRLLPFFGARGLKVAVLKHSHHADPDLGERGKDTWRYRQAGARAVALAAPGLLQVTRSFAGEPRLEEALAALAGEVDVVLVEGYKRGPLPKVAVLRPEDGGEAPPYPNLIALVSDGPVTSRLPVFQRDQVEELGRWLYDYFVQE
ncbi:MAG: molybdopterin-guanine dinucleotide biosynthesis protein B [Desulfobaccales bacterium]